MANVKIATILIPKRTHFMKISKRVSVNFKKMATPTVGRPWPRGPQKLTAASTPILSLIQAL